jgi:hypothetical protein
MATRFVRVDLSDSARDFSPIAVEPGVPMLDRAGANSKILFHWLGGMLAEPVWEGDCVNYFVREDHGGRLEDVICQPASQGDLKGILKDDVAKLRQRLDQCRPETPTERILHRVLQRTFLELVDNPNRHDLDCYFFRYRDVLGNWRLVWCWGYQRMEQEPAPAVVCNDPACNLLFVRRPGKSPKCPDCEAVWSFRPVQKTNWKLASAAALLLLLLLGLVSWWALRPSRLVVTPSTVSSRVGSRVEFQVRLRGLFLRGTDVTSQAIGISYNPQIARYHQADSSATLTGPGTTEIHFQYGALRAVAALSVDPGANPEKIMIEPRTVELAVGSTARLKVMGQYKDGHEADLTDAVEWKTAADGVVYAAGGLLEGVAQGSTTVSARYRATPDSPYLDAAANVSVAKVKFESLAVGIEPSAIRPGLSGAVRIDALGDDGKRYSLLESSQLRADVSPSYLATLHARHLEGERPGAGKLTAGFGPDLAGEAAFTVGNAPRIGPEVRPEAMELVVGEIADIAYLSPSRARVHLSSSAPRIVDVTDDNRVVGRAVGQAQVSVLQGGQTLGTVDVTVVHADFQAISIDPGSIGVAVDGVLRPRVYGWVQGADGLRAAELAPQFLTAEKVPSPVYADFNKFNLELRGVQPTKPKLPQLLALALGPKKASAPVEVVIAPCRLEITPVGPINLPVGQLMRLQGWATYTGGRCVQVPAERMRWASEEKALPGLRLYGDRIGAIQAGAGPLNVYASYFNRESNRVQFNSIEADPNVRLAIEVDRDLRLAGEPGLAILSASGPTGDVELVPELAAFKSSDEKTVKIGEKTGSFTAGAVGEATLTASHPAGKDPATRRLKVCDPAKARLVFEPASASVAVNERGVLPLYLEAEVAGKMERALMEGAGVGYYIARPEAVRWLPPVLTGLSAAPPFELSASYAPWLRRSASAKVEVTAGQVIALRVSPDALTLAPGQAVPLTVEQQVAANGPWQEVRPDAVTWTVPPGLVWTPPTEGLRPTVGVAEGFKGNLSLEAKVGEVTAAAEVTSKESGPDLGDPTARLVLDREPGGTYLAVGRQQRYTILVEKQGAAEPAAEVHWPANFDNEFVAWDAPVLTAKKENYTQWLRADVGGRTVLVRTTTCLPGAYEKGEPGYQPVQPRGDVPEFVLVLSDQGPLVRFPVGAIFSDFRVEAHYPDGFTRLVTKRATIRTPEPPASAILTASGGKLIGVRTGSTQVSAEYDGVKSREPPLRAEVLAGVDIDKLVIEPAPLSIRPGENVGLRAIGYKNTKNIGDITGLGGIQWKSGNEQVALTNGPTVQGVSLGQAALTAARGTVTSEPCDVLVTDSITDNLRIDPKTIVLTEGEGVQLGYQLHVFRGDLDVSQQCYVVPELPGVVQWVPQSRSLVGLRAGTTPLTFSMGDKVYRTMVEVQPSGGVINGEIVVEPAKAILAPGQAEMLRVYVIRPEGDRVDRTASALFQSSDESVVKVIKGWACALAPGKAQIKAMSSQDKRVLGEAAVEVLNEEITELAVNPPQLVMSVGDNTALQIFGQAPTAGAHEMFDQSVLPASELRVAPLKQGVVATAGHQVQALAPGQDAIDVAYRDKLRKQVPVTVGNNPFADLRIEPATATIHAGDALTYQVTAMRGGQRQVLGAANAVQLLVDKPEVAQALGGLNVMGSSPGTTTVVAQLGEQKAEATLQVTQRGAVIEGPAVPGVTAPGGVIYDDQGHVIYGGDVVYVDPDTGRIIRVAPGGGVAGGGSVVVPNGAQRLVEAPLAGRSVGLCFLPDKLSIATNSGPVPVQVFEALEGGVKGREVTADPSLQLSEPGDCVKLEKGDRGPTLRPVHPGQSRLSATLGPLASAAPLLIDVGGEIPLVTGLNVSPDPMLIWTGEKTRFGSVRIDPPNGDTPFPVEYKVTAPEGQGIVSVDAENNLTGKAIGQTLVTVAPTDPKYQAMTRQVSVQVGSPAALVFDPPRLTIGVGEVTPLIKITSTSPDGSRISVPALVESADPNIVDRVPSSPGCFVGKALGETQLKASYRGRDAICTVSVSGKRFQNVKWTATRGKDDFTVTIEVLAAESEGELEYRVYREGTTAEETWVPNQPAGGARKATLTSPAISYGKTDEVYHLVIEAKDKAGKSIQTYPLRLRSTLEIEEVKDPNQPKDVK